MSDAVMVPRAFEEWLYGLEGYALRVERLSEEMRDPVDKLLPWLLAAFDVGRLAASTPVGGWEDISTAPKDGTNIDLWCRDVKTGESYHFPDSYWCRDRQQWHGWDEYIWPEADVPTHWMRLPPPPSVSTGSRAQEGVPTEQAAPTVVSGWDREICTGCTASLSIADIKARGIVSCCPDRHMVRIRGLIDAYTARPPRIPSQPAEGCSEKPVLSDRREMAKGVAPRTDPVLVLRETCQRLLDDYQTSEAHHPNHVLVLKADFEALRKAADGCSSNEGAGK